MAGTNDFANGFIALEKLRIFCEAHDEMMGLAMSAAKDMDANQFDLYKGGTFHGVCQAIATMADVPVSLVEETMCDFAEVDY